MTPFPILVSSAGRRGALVGILRRSLANLGLSGPILATDVSGYAAAFHLADRGIVVPPQADPGFVDALLDVCERERVRLVVPTHDGELPLLAAARDRFDAIGTAVSISAPETIAIGRDKAQTHAWLTEHGFPTVRQGSVSDVLAAAASWQWPLIAKPRSGSAGIGVVHCASVADLPEGDVVVQELARGAEHTVDVLVLRDGRCRVAVPRRRIEVRAGEVAKAVTVRHAALEALVRGIAEMLPGAYGVLNVQVFVAGDELRVIEVNARYGGGFPLAYEAGARLPDWTIEELLGRPSTASDDWREGLVMLRYDEAVFVDAAAIPSASSAYQLG
jgi:carbamoyl-phosphate synthase large subunit